MIYISSKGNTMEVIFIDSARLKIMLSDEDMAAYGLKHCDGDGGEIARGGLRRLLREAGEPLGISTEGERILVQLYTSQRGGGELFVTLLGKPSPTAAQGGGNPSPSATFDGEGLLLRRLFDPEEGGDHPLSDGNWLHSNGRIQNGGGAPAEVSAARTKRAEGTRLEGGSVCTRTARRAGWVMDSFPALLAICRRLRSIGALYPGDLYHVEGGEWCLILELPEEGVYGIPPKLWFLAEYGREEDGKALWRYAAEYGRLIRSGDAVSLLGEL
jgi:hypothetical protein